MAIEVCSDDSSPRISFSHDISQSDTMPVEPYIRSTDYSSSSSPDFDFCVFHQSFDLESSSADELFFDGKILPIEMKRKIPPTLPPNKAKKTSITPNENLMEMPKSGNLGSNENQNSKSFWRIKRSNSLNCGSSSNSSASYARTLCPIPLLPRSYSTGSTPSVKHKQHYQKSSSSVSNGHYYYQKPPLRKIPNNPYSNGIKINSNLFGLSSIFSSRKEKNKKR
ncbi:hypothetical protein P3S67_024739 [Capsicum chacoense]